MDDVAETADEVFEGKDAVVYAVGLSGGVPRGKLAWSVGRAPPLVVPSDTDCAAPGFCITPNLIAV